MKIRMGRFGFHSQNLRNLENGDTDMKGSIYSLVN